MDFIFWSKIRFGGIGFGVRMAGFESQLQHFFGYVTLGRLT